MAYPTTPIHGKLCRVEKNNVLMSFTTGWTITANLDMADISAQGDSWKTALPGLAGWSGSFNTEFVYGNTEQAAAYDNLLTASPGTKLTDVKFLEDTTANGFSGNIYITSITVNAAMGDKVTATVNFQGDGALAHSNAQ